MWKYEILFVCRVLHDAPTSSPNNVLQGIQMVTFPHHPKFSGLLLPPQYDSYLIIPTTFNHPHQL